MNTVTCPRCGSVNPANAMNCRQCRINLKFALEGPTEEEQGISRPPKGINCEQCARKGAEAIFACPQRPSGRCPYVEEWRGKELGWFGFIFLVGLGVGLVVIALSAKTSLLLGLLAAGLTIFVAICLICTVTVQLYNPHSGVRLQRTTVWSIELSYRWITRANPVPIELELAQPLIYPPSVTALPMRLSLVPMKQAVAIVRAALIGLLAKKYIQVYHLRIYEFKRWRGRRTARDDYLIVATEQAEQAWSAGELERRIRGALAYWPAIWEKAKQRPEGPSIFTLVRAIYDRDENNPQSWLAQLVAKNAAAQRWGQIKGGFAVLKRFELDAAHATQIQQEQEIVKALSKRLAQLHLDFSLTVDEEIKRGIGSRQAKADPERQW